MHKTQCITLHVTQSLRKSRMSITKGLCKGLQLYMFLHCVYLPSWKMFVNKRMKMVSSALKVIII